MNGIAGSRDQGHDDRDQDIKENDVERIDNYDANCVDGQTKDNARQKYNVAQSDYLSWTKKYGTDGAEIIRRTVERYMPDYEYLLQFAMKV